MATASMVVERFPLQCLVMGWIVLVAGVLVSLLLIVSADGKKYLYHEEGKSSSGPVIDLLAPSSPHEDPIKPYFLYESPSNHSPPPARVVVSRSK